MAATQLALAVGMIGFVLVGCQSSYVGAYGHGNLPTNTHNDDEVEAGSEGTPGGSLVVGGKLTSILSAEGEVTGRTSNLHGYNHGDAAKYDGLDRESAVGDARMVAGMGNLWLEPPEDLFGITPYVGGGVGLGIQTLDGVSSVTRTAMDDTTLEPAYQYGAGVRVGLTESLGLDLGVRHFDGGAIEHNSAMVGLTWTWG